MQHYRKFLIGMVMLIVTSLACSLGGGDNTVQQPQPPQPTQQPQGTSIAQQPTTGPVVQPQPTQAPIVGQPTITPQQPPSPTPTNTPPSGTGPGGCVLSAAFVADLTIPDNTIEAPGASFVKTWRIKNNGTCVWDPSYQLVFASGDQMSGPAGVPINNTAPGANLDVSVSLKASGTESATPYAGKWTLKASNGVIFGGQYTVVIVVPLPASPTPTPTATPSATPGGGPWAGHWDTNCGPDACAGMDLVQTGNTVVGTYAGGGGTINGSVSGNHLHGTWTRGTSGSIDWWLNGSQTKWRGNWDGVNGWCAHRTGDSDPAPCGVGTFDGDWTAVCSGCNGAMHIDQNGQNFTGTYVNGTIDGTIDGAKLTGNYHCCAGETNSIVFFLLNYNQFNGNYTSGAGHWCGYRGGAIAPSPCLAP